MVNETIEKAVKTLFSKGITPMTGYKDDHIDTVYLSVKNIYIYGKVDEMHRSISFKIDCPKTERETAIEIINEFMSLTGYRIVKR